MESSIVSVNVAQPRTVEWQGESVATGIFKTAVDGPVPVRFLNLAGDRQADLSVHGGPDKAVYAYPIEHYAFWRGIYAERALAFGEFGENLTTEGLLEDQVFIGDRFRAGSALFELTQPRIPCYKLGIKFGDQEILQRFLHSRRTGFYLKVVEEGSLKAGDAMQRVVRGAISVANVMRVAFDRSVDPILLRQAAEASALPEIWRAKFRKRLAAID